MFVGRLIHGIASELLLSGFLASDDQAVEDAMLKYWVALARKGNSNTQRMVNWRILNGVQSGVRTDKCDFWDTLQRSEWRPLN